jgi:hypothetical protein
MIHEIGPGRYIGPESEKLSDEAPVLPIPSSDQDQIGYPPAQDKPDCGWEPAGSTWPPLATPYEE